MKALEKATNLFIQITFALAITLALASINAVVSDTTAVVAYIGGN